MYFKSISGESVVYGYCNISHLLKYPSAKWAWLTKVGGHRQTVVASIVRKKKDDAFLNACVRQPQRRALPISQLFVALL